MTKGNGVFKWWMCLNEDDEYYHGPYDTKAEAISAGLDEYGNDADHDRFFVMECDKTMVVYGGVDEADLAEQVAESIAESNEMCWGEDGWDDAWSPEEMKSLAQALKATISGWLDANPAHTWAVGAARECEQIDIAKAKSAVV